MLSWSSVVASDDVQVESKLLFNTICAKCHEGECSGRLSLHLEGKAVDQHILRHAGELSSTTVRELSELLRYMKEKCSFYPMAIDISQDGILERRALDKLRSPTKQAYFIPLGGLKPDHYIIRLEGVNADSGCYMEIVDTEFEFVEKGIVSYESGTIGVEFHIDEQSDIHLRITSQKPISLNKLELLNCEETGC